MIKKNSLIVILVVAVGLSSSVSAQTVVVDTSRGTNHFVPTETLGAGVDRIPVEAIDKDLLQPTLGQTLESRILIASLKGIRDVDQREHFRHATTRLRELATAVGAGVGKRELATKREKARAANRHRHRGY